MNMFRSNLEKDFEYFVRNISKLNNTEFCGLAKILSVPMVRLENIDKEKLKELTPEELEKMKMDPNKEYLTGFVRPMSEVLEEMMDRFLVLNRKRRKEINQILKDVQRGR